MQRKFFFHKSINVHEIEYLNNVQLAKWKRENTIQPLFKDTRFLTINLNVPDLSYLLMCRVILVSMIDFLNLKIILMNFKINKKSMSRARI